MSHLKRTNGTDEEEHAPNPKRARVDHESEREPEPELEPESEPKPAAEVVTAEPELTQDPSLTFDEVERASTPSTQDPNEVLDMPPPPLEAPTQVDVKTPAVSAKPAPDPAPASSSSSSAAASATASSVEQAPESEQKRTHRLMRASSDILNAYSEKRFSSVHLWDDQNRLYVFTTCMFVGWVWPEMVVTGLPKDTAHKFLRGVWDGIKSRKIDVDKRWIEGERVEKAVSGLDYDFTVKMIFDLKPIQPEELRTVLCADADNPAYKGLGFAYQLVLDPADSLSNHFLLA